MRRALSDLISAAPLATIGTVLWIVIAYFFHQNMIDAMTGGQEVTRREEPRLYNILENLCISRGIPMPKLKAMDSDALNAFATGMNQRQYSITVTSGLLRLLDDAEIESVLGHELTHVRNGDVRMMVVAVIIAGVVSFFAELFFRLWFYGGLRGSRSSDERRGGGAGIAILIAVALIVLAYLLSFIIRLALSRSREFLADAGSVELTKSRPRPAARGNHRPRADPGMRQPRMAPKTEPAARRRRRTSTLPRHRDRGGLARQARNPR